MRGLRRGRGVRVRGGLGASGGRGALGRHSMVAEVVEMRLDRPGPGGRGRGRGGRINTRHERPGPSNIDELA